MVGRSVGPRARSAGAGGPGEQTVEVGRRCGLENMAGGCHQGRGRRFPPSRCRTLRLRRPENPEPSEKAGSSVAHMGSLPSAAGVSPDISHLRRPRTPHSCAQHPGQRGARRAENHTNGRTEHSDLHPRFRSGRVSMASVGPALLLRAVDQQPHCAAQQGLGPASGFRCPRAACRLPAATRGGGSPRPGSSGEGRNALTQNLLWSAPQGLVRTPWSHSHCPKLPFMPRARGPAPAPRPVPTEGPGVELSPDEARAALWLSSTPGPLWPQWQYRRD